MKRLIKNHPTVTFEINIDIVNSYYTSVLSSTDLSGTEYDSFIISMMALFQSAGYSVSHDEEYTHYSNRMNSLSEYFTFTRWVDNVQVIVIVNVRISDHPDVPRGRYTSDEKRSNYVSRIGKEIADSKGTDQYISYPLDITFDDQHLKSYTSAQFKIHSRIKAIDKEVQEIVADLASEGGQE